MTSGMDPNMIIYHLEQLFFLSFLVFCCYLGQEHGGHYSPFGVVEDRDDLNIHSSFLHVFCHLEQLLFSKHC